MCSTAAHLNDFASLLVSSFTHCDCSTSSQVSNVAQQSGSVSSQESYCHSLRCFSIVLVVPLLLPWVALHWLLGQLCFVSGFSLPLNKVASCCLRCPTATHWSCFLSSWVSHYHLLGWLSVIPGVSLLSLVWLVPFQVSHCCLLFHFRCSTVCHLGGSVLFMVHHCYSPGWFLMVQGVPLWLTGVALHHSGCLTFTNWVGSTSSQLSHCHSLMRFCIMFGVSLLFTKVVPHCHTCLIAFK